MNEKLLVVDYDYFFPHPLECCTKHTGREQGLLYDWGHRENEMFITMLWQVRGASFFAAGLDLPGMSDERQHFWDRFQFAESARLYVADSNVYAASHELTQHDIREVYLFDAHHDAGYGAKSWKQWLARHMDGNLTCEDWMVTYYLRNAQLHVRYPRWKGCWKQSDGKPAVPEANLDRRLDNWERPLPVFDHVFVCRSGAWVPSWCEDSFWSFLAACPVDYAPNGILDGMTRRTFDFEEAQKQGKMFSDLRHEMEHAQRVAGVLLGPESTRREKTHATHETRPTRRAQEPRRHAAFAERPSRPGTE